jgi:copper chaperone CopZ
MKNSNNQKSCCQTAAKENKTKESKGIGFGLLYGLVPHVGCIAFIVFTVLGVTTATALFKPLLLNPYFFYILIALSLGFATVSALVYLNKHGILGFHQGSDGRVLTLSLEGIRGKWKYLTTLFGTTIATNLLLFMVIFPLLANINTVPVAAASAQAVGNLNSIKLQVDIPCSGHAPLISDELKKVSGVTNVKFDFPNYFEVSYDSTKTSKQQILSLDVFNTYKASVVSESRSSSNDQVNNLAGTGTTTESAVKSSGSNVATVTNGVQVVQLSVQGRDYYPNPIVVKKGIPVQLVADMNSMPGCSRSVVIPEFGISKVLSASDNVIDFTPDKSGTFQFSCSMGMYLGQIVVQEADGSVAQYTGNVQAASGPSCGVSSGGGGCGCGGQK